MSSSRQLGDQAEDHAHEVAHPRDPNTADTRVRCVGCGELVSRKSARVGARDECVWCVGGEE